MNQATDTTAEVGRTPRAIKKNALANYGNVLTQAALGILVNPILVHALGPTSFGIWKTCQRFLDFASVADGRATQALKWVVAHSSGRADDSTNQRDVGAAIVVWLIWLPLLVLLAVGTIFGLPHLIANTVADQHSVITLTSALLAANIVLSGLLMIPDSVLVGVNQGYRSMNLTTLVAAVSNGAMVTAALLGGGVSSLALIVLSASIINGALTWIVVRRRVDWWGVRRPTRADIQRLSGFSGWVLAWELLTKLFLATELALISILIGPVAVSDYTFTAYVTQFCLSLCLLTASAFMPALGSLLGSQAHREAAVIARRTKQLTLSIATVTGAATLLFNGPFVHAWAGGDRYLGATVNALMVLTLLQWALIRSDAQILDAALDMRWKVLMGSAGAVLSILAAWVSFQVTDSLTGLYIGMIAARGVMTIIFPRRVETLLPNSSLRLIECTCALALLSGAYFVGSRLEGESLAVVCAAGGIALALTSIIVWRYLLPPSLRGWPRLSRRRNATDQREPLA